MVTKDDFGEGLRSWGGGWVGGSSVYWDGSLLPVEMLIPLLDATAVNITHGINILLTRLICGSEAVAPPPPFLIQIFF